MSSYKFTKLRIKNSNIREDFIEEEEANNSFVLGLDKKDKKNDQGNSLDKALTDFSSKKDFQFHIDNKDKGTRIDKYLTGSLKEYTRSHIQKLIQDGLILVNDKNVKANYKVRQGDTIKVTIPAKEAVEIVPENLPLNILYEDDDIIVINKEKGMVVHPANGHLSGTLVNGLLYHYGDNLSTVNGEFRPGIVHRLDMDTSGALIVCKNDHAHELLAIQFKNNSVVRKYHAICYNAFSEEEGTIDAPIGRHPVARKRMSINYENGKRAITHYKLIQNLKDNFAYVECSLETGRTHQIRVHMASINHPVLGDHVYGPKSKRFKLDGQVLHARKIGFMHPTKGEYMEFEAGLPVYFNKVIKRLSS